jgi:Phytanoyl-CoA dioxygenase (PhyH)
MGHSFQENGFEVLPLFSESQVDGFRNAIQARVDETVRELEIPLETTFPDESIGRRLDLIAQADQSLAESILLSVYSLAHLDPCIAFLDGYPTLRLIAEKLVGKPIRSFTIRVRANVPSLPGKRQGWHSDVSVLDDGEFAKVRIACWAPLADAHAGNGTLEVVPGIRTAPMAHEGDPTKHTIHEDALDGMERVVIECGKGSALFLDSFVPHRAVPNLGDEVRWSVITWMMV